MVYREKLYLWLKSNEARVYRIYSRDPIVSLKKKCEHCVHKYTLNLFEYNHPSSCQTKRCKLFYCLFYG